jgi:hypothetical protein
MAPTKTKQSYVILYRRRGDKQWIVHHGWIPPADAEDLRGYLATLPACEEFYVVPNEPKNNTFQLFGAVRSDFSNPADDHGTSSMQLAERRSVTQRLLKRYKVRIREESQGEAAIMEQLCELQR